MKNANLTRAAGLIALIALLACKSLDVVNPNEPDAKRALTDPAALEALAGGTLRSWSNTYQGMESAGVMTTQAQSFTSSWNNFNMNLDTSIDADGTRGTRAWQNDPAAAGRTHSVAVDRVLQHLSSATDVVKRSARTTSSSAIPPTPNAPTPCSCGGDSLGIALNYDKAASSTRTPTSRRSHPRIASRFATPRCQALLDAATVAKANATTPPAGPAGAATPTTDCPHPTRWPRRHRVLSAQCSGKCANQLGAGRDLRRRACRAVRRSTSSYRRRLLVWCNELLYWFGPSTAGAFIRA
jgi:hypothetical protein